MMTRKKYGFKGFIKKSLPLSTSKGNDQILSKGSIVYYKSRTRLPGQIVKGKLDKIVDGRLVYCRWERDEEFTSWGWMPISEVFVDIGALEGVPIITVPWDDSLGEKPL